MKGCDTNLVEKLKLSVVIVALNEELNIERCVKSVQWADEILIYDSGSNDNTLSIAQSLGAKVISGPWLGFGATKSKATALAKNDWILALDADEEVPKALFAEIENLFTLDNSVLDTKALDNTVAYRIPRLSNYLKKWVRFGGWYPDYQVRLFNRQHASWSTDTIHEKVEATHYKTMTNHLNHYVFKNIHHHIAKNNDYSGLLANKLFRSGKKFSWFHFFTKPTVKFFECYILKLGFLDGWVGFFIARGAAYSVLLKWSKLKELEMNET